MHALNNWRPRPAWRGFAPPSPGPDDVTCGAAAGRAASGRDSSRRMRRPSPAGGRPLLRAASPRRRSRPAGAAGFHYCGLPARVGGADPPAQPASTIAGCQPASAEPTRRLRRLPLLRAASPRRRSRPLWRGFAPPSPKPDDVTCGPAAGRAASGRDSSRRMRRPSPAGGRPLLRAASPRRRSRPAGAAGFHYCGLPARVGAADPPAQPAPPPSPGPDAATCDVAAGWAAAGRGRTAQRAGGRAAPGGRGSRTARPERDEHHQYCPYDHYTDREGHGISSGGRAGGPRPPLRSIAVRLLVRPGRRDEVGKLP
jgi:hypothetical protein